MKSGERDPTSLRDAHFTDLARLQEIERQAGEVFRDVGMNAVADDEPLGLERLRGYAERGQAWVSLTATSSASLDPFSTRDVMCQVRLGSPWRALAAVQRAAVSGQPVAGATAPDEKLMRSPAMVSSE